MIDFDPLGVVSRDGHLIPPECREPDGWPAPPPPDWDAPWEEAWNREAAQRRHGFGGGNLVGNPVDLV